MCGIFGITNFSNEEAALYALRTFAYRGPDHTGHFFENDVFLGNNRLSIIDLDERSNQPQFNPERNLAIVFNGEIFNYQELKEELSLQGHIFRTESDTEVLLHLYQQYGESFISKLRGMFAVAIFDKDKNKIFVFRDHVGIKPLYYAIINGQFIFSSELKGITAIQKNLKLSRRSFILASALGYVPTPLTIYDQVYKLQAGAVLRYDLSSQELDINKNAFVYEDSVVNDVPSLTELVEKKILSHLIGDVPVGLFFSGGTDSSLIAAILKKHNISLKTYSIIMSNKSDDSEYIDKIGAYLDLQVRKVVFGVGEFDASFDEVRALIDEPTFDSSMLALHYISKIAAKEVKVVLSGEGADEFFFGYRRHPALAQLSRFRPRKYSFLDLLYNVCAQLKGRRRVFMDLYRLFKDPYSYYLTAISDAPTTLGWNEWRSLFAEERISTMELDQKYYLENDLLRKMDLATSYVSIEGRVPFLDADIISASKNFRKKFEKATILKPVLKSVLSQYIPSELVYRNKSGLGLDVKKIFRESRHFNRNLNDALLFLQQQDTFSGLVPRVHAAKLSEEAPYYAFLLLTYYFSIKNTSLS